MEVKISNINFTFTEAFNSDYAKAWGINNVTTNKVHLDNILKTIVFVAQPIRNKIYDKYKKGVNVCGFYRSAALIAAANKKGIIMSTSERGHAAGCAVDISVTGMTQEALFKFIISMIKNGELEVDQLIWEKDSNCVHVGYVHGSCRHQIMVREYKNGKLTYTDYKG